MSKIYYAVLVTGTRCFTLASDKIPRNDKPGPNLFDINYRAIIAFREIGKGYNAISKFCGVMNFPSAMVRTTYKSISHEISEAYTKCAEVSMKNAP